MRPSPRTGPAMSHALDPGASDRAPYSGAPAARAHRTEPNTTYYVDREGVVVRTYRNTGYPNAMGHRRDLGRGQGHLRPGHVFVAVLIAELLGLVVFGLLMWLWR